MQTRFAEEGISLITPLLMYVEKTHRYSLKNIRTSSGFKWQQQIEDKLLRVQLHCFENRIEQKTVSVKTLNHKDMGHDFPSAIQTYW